MLAWKKYVLLLVALAAVAYLGAPLLGRGPVDTDYMQEGTTANFAEVVEQAESWVVVDFWAPWCGPCRRMMPALDELAGDYAGRITFVKVNIDEEPALAERFHITSIPYVYLFRDGRPVDAYLGYRAKSRIREWLDERVDKEGGRTS